MALVLVAPQLGHSIVATKVSELGVAQECLDVADDRGRANRLQVDAMADPFPRHQVGDPCFGGADGGGGACWGQGRTAIVWVGSMTVCRLICVVWPARPCQFGGRFSGYLTYTVPSGPVTFSGVKPSWVRVFRILRLVPLQLCAYSRLVASACTQPSVPRSSMARTHPASVCKARYQLPGRSWPTNCVP
jgi:hypothetical protein